MRFEGKVVAVTGGSSGIGRAVALQAASEGASVMIVARNEERAHQVVREIEDAGGTARFARCDVRRQEHCQQAVDQAIRDFGQLDVLVNNSGVAYRMRDVTRTTHEEWHETFDVNVHGTFYMCKSAMPHLIERRGAVVNMASYLGLVGVRDMVAYCASKGAIVQMTRAMALDHAEAGVRVNCVCPGTVMTSMIERAWEEYGKGAETAWITKHPVKRVSEAHEIAEAVLFLASDQASFITGVALPVDGGITAG